MELAFLNIGSQEMILIVIVILLLFGGKKLPELARGLGRGIREFKDASEGIKREIADQINNFEQDLDVTKSPSNDNQKQTAQATEGTTPQAEEPMASSADQLANVEDAQSDSPEEKEKKKPQFSAPANTYQYDPGAHPVDESEYYKYGYNNDVADADTGATEPAGADSNKTPEDNPSKQA